MLFEYAGRLGAFATLTFPWPVTKGAASSKGKRFGRLLNESIYGKRYRDHAEGLISVFTVECSLKIGARLANPHLHYLIEKHPSVTPERIRNVWAKIAGRAAAHIGVKVEPIRSVKEAMGYILKYVTWEHGPEAYIPYDPKTRKVLR